VGKKQMDEIEKIYIKLELCKDKSSGLAIITHFNPKAPNFQIEGDNYSWMPTDKERNLLNEAFQLISKEGNKNPEEKNILKFLDKQKTQEKTNENLKHYEKTLETFDINKNIDIDNKITITESDNKEIDETIEKQNKKQDSLSNDDNKEI
jgi:hypothetical protein